MQLVQTYVVAPIAALFWDLYFSGPTLGGYGFWGGKEPADICQELTGISSSHWAEHPDPCYEKLTANFNAFRIGVTTIIAILLTWKLLSMLLWHIFFVRPMMKALIARVSPRRLLGMMQHESVKMVKNDDT